MKPAVRSRDTKRIDGFVGARETVAEGASSGASERGIGVKGMVREKCCISCSTGVLYGNFPSNT